MLQDASALLQDARAPYRRASTSPLRRTPACEYGVISDPTAVFFILATVVTVAVALEARLRLFRSLGSALVGILIAMLLSNLGLIPGSSPVYDFLGGPAVSAGIALILLSVDVRTIFKAGPTMLAAFGVGALGSAAGASVAAFMLSDAVGPESWKLAGQYTATYTGGGANFAAVGAALDTSGELFSAGIAADVIMTAIWMAVCLAAPLVFGKRTDNAGPMLAPGEAADPEEADADGETSASLYQRLYGSTGSMRLSDVAALTGVVFASLWGADLLAGVFPRIPSVLWLTTIALLLAQLKPVKQLRGAAVIGNYLVLLFLASNGASSVIANIVAVGPPIFYFALTTIAVHGTVIFGLGRLVGLDVKTLAVASQANVGGPASAMALASARGYTKLLLPGVAVGLLGYAVGNYAGFAVATVIRGMIGG